MSGSANFTALTRLPVANWIEVLAFVVAPCTFQRGIAPPPFRSTELSFEDCNSAAAGDSDPTGDLFASLLAIRTLAVSEM